MFGAVISLICIWITGGRRDKPGLSDTPVVPLTATNYTKFLQVHEYNLIGFVRKQCPKCELFKEVLDDVSKVLSSARPPYGIGIINLDRDPSLAETFNIVDVPALLWLKGSGEVEAAAYSGKMDKNKIYKWLLSLTACLLTECKDLWECEEPSISDFSHIKLVAQVPDKESEGFQIVQALSDKTSSLSLGIQYKYFVDPQLNATQDGIVTRFFFHHNNERRISGQISSSEDAREWVKLNGRPLFGPLDEITHELYSQISNEWVVLCGDEDDYSHFRTIFQGISRAVRSRYNVVWVDTSTTMHTLQEMFGNVECPSVLLIDKNSRKFEYNSGRITEDNILHFIKKVELDEIKPKLKSQDTNEIGMERGILKMVASAFQTWATSNRGFFRVIYVYATWCSHCKTFTPLMENIAEKIQSKYPDTFKFAKLNADKNDLDYDLFGPVDGLPTLFMMIPPDNNRIDFNSDNRTQVKVMEWIDTHYDSWSGSLKEEL